MYQRKLKSPIVGLTAEQSALAESHLDVALNVAGRFARSWPKLRDEFRGEASLAITQAARQFDPSSQDGFGPLAYVAADRRCRTVLKNNRPKGFRDRYKDDSPSVVSLSDVPPTLDHRASGVFKLDDVDEAQWIAGRLGGPEAIAWRAMAVGGADVAQAEAMAGITRGRAFWYRFGRRKIRPILDEQVKPTLSDPDADVIDLLIAGDLDPDEIAARQGATWWPAWWSLFYDRVARALGLTEDEIVTFGRNWWLSPKNPFASWIREQRANRGT